MSRQTNNYPRKHINFIESLVEIGEPFQSTLLEKYPEYKNNIEAYKNDEKECFLSILNKIGEDGCQVLTDRVVNYIDDISNIDTTIPSALLSQAESIGYPYKDKKTVEQLTKLSKCSPIIQSLVWAVSTKASNSKIILDRLNIISNETKNQIAESYNTDELNDKISSDFYDLFNPNKSSSIFGRRYLYLDKNQNSEYVTSDGAPALIDFTWMANTIFSNTLMTSINSYDEKTYLEQYDSWVINFGKYNYTLFSIICFVYLYSKLYTLNAINSNNIEQINSLNIDIDQWNRYAKELMPFLYNNNLFDPLQAAWSIIYDAKTLDDYEINYHPIILDFIKAFNEKLNNISYNAVMDFLLNKPTYNENLSFVLKLNANSFTYQQLMIQIISDIKNIFNIDIVEYSNFNNIFYNNYFSNHKNNGGFAYLENSLLSNLINWDQYIKDIISNIFKLGKNIKILREDLRVMTLRNSYKGTTALIQFSVIEYLKECIEDLLYQSYDKYNKENPNHEQKKVSKSLLNDILETINGNKERNKENTKQDDIGINEYWDYTEYFNRVDGKNQKEDDGHRVDWFLDNGDFSHKYGTMNEDEILEFYTQVLNLPKDIYFIESEEDKKNGNNWTDISSQKIKLKTFLEKIYNIGVFSTKTNSNYELIYSGNKNNTTNKTFWEVYKNSDYISKEIHPYIWNFIKNVSNRLYSSSAVTTAIQNLEYEILAKHINGNTNDKNITGNILDQYRLSENFVDSSGYVTRYEHRDHEVGEVTQSYDGIVHPMFGYQFIKNNWYLSAANIDNNWGEISSTWYTNQKVTLSKNMEQKEISCLKDLIDNANFIKSLTGGDNTPISGVLSDYCIDRYETAYAVEPHGEHRLIYKENGYPFMRPLLNGDKGMLFIKANYEIDDPKEDVKYSDVSADSFPRIVMSRDGTHILMRTGKNKLSSYSVLTSKNKNNEFEKALKLNVEIECDDIIFEKEYFNDNLIKTIDDDFYILVPKYDSNISAFNNYLFYIKKTGEIKVVKEIFHSEDQNEIFRSGMFLNNYSGKSILINTYYFNKDQYILENSEISAVYKNNVNSFGNHTTSYDNWKVENSSFDLLNQFIQMYVSKPYKKSNSESKFIDIPLDNKDELSATPSVDLRISNIDTKVKNYQTEISIVDGLFNNITTNLYKSTTLPFARSFNINSDAGFNPVYIGERGKIILQNHRGDPEDDETQSQWRLLKETGTAFELLGPEIKFDENPTIDSTLNENIYDENVSNDDVPFERIHECYSFLDEYYNLAQSFDISGETRKTSYRYGYTSIIENSINKNDVYRIKNVHEILLDKFDNNENPTCVSSSQMFKINLEDGYDYNRIYIFLGINNRLYSLVPRKQTTMLQLKTQTNSEFAGIAGFGIYGSSEGYSINFKDTYVFNEINFSGSSNNRIIKLYGNARELINTKVYLVHVVEKDTTTQSYNFIFKDQDTNKKMYLEIYSLNNEISLRATEATDFQEYKDHITIKSDNNLYYNVFLKNQSLYVEQTTNQEDIHNAYDNSTNQFKIRLNSSNSYKYALTVNDSQSQVSLNIINIEESDFTYQVETEPFTPNFMLPQQELVKCLSSLSNDSIDEHMRAPYTMLNKSYNNIKYATTDHETNHEILDIEKTLDGSLVFSITEVDSDLMNMQIPDQWKEHNIPKSVTTEAINGCLRYQYMLNPSDPSNPITFDKLNYQFKPFEIIDLDLKRVEKPNVDFGIDENDNNVDTQYIIQPYENHIIVSKDDINKYTVSFWRKQEKDNTGTANSYDNNLLPNKVKITDYALVNNTIKNYRPVYGQEHESLNDYINNSDFIPRLMVQWEYSGDSHNSEINLRFNNATVGDSLFINTNAGLEYKSLSTFKDSIIVKPRESKYIDIVAPNHIQIGRTVFYNIPIMRALVTNISDNKPKFMLTILNDKTDSRVTLGYNNYALVFMSSSDPQNDNSNIVYTTCYVAPMVSSNQTTPPSVSNAIALSELSFNFDVANILNIKNIIDEETGINNLENNNLLVERINVISKNNKISQTAKSCIGIINDMHQIRVSEPYGTIKDSEGHIIEKGFTTIDMKINLQDLSEFNLKNALLTAHGNVIAYDKFGTSIPIVKVFGCSLNNIGEKHVLSINNDILTVTQNSNRTTAIQVTKNSTQEYETT